MSVINLCIKYNYLTNDDIKDIENITISSIPLKFYELKGIGLFNTLNFVEFEHEGHGIKLNSDYPKDECLILVDFVKTLAASQSSCLIILSSSKVPMIKCYFQNGKVGTACIDASTILRAVAQFIKQSFSSRPLLTACLDDKVLNTTTRMDPKFEELKSELYIFSYHGRAPHDDVDWSQHGTIHISLNKCMHAEVEDLTNLFSLFADYFKQQKLKANSIVLYADACFEPIRYIGYETVPIVKIQLNSEYQDVLCLNIQRLVDAVKKYANDKEGLYISNLY